MMHRIQVWTNWLRDNPDAVIDLVRIYLGIGLFIRGVLFISFAEGVTTLVDLSEFSLASAAIAHYVTFAHLIGGLLLAVGLLTRLAAALQIPVLIGAVGFVHIQEGLLTAGQSLEFSALVLFLLVAVFAFGAGRFSLDYYVFVRETEEESTEKPAFLQDKVKPAARRFQEKVAEKGAAGAMASTSTAGIKHKECSCGNDLTHERVVAEPRYSIWAGFFFMLGISAPVREVVFYCQECGTIMKRTKDPAMLRQYRWHTG